MKLRFENVIPPTPEAFHETIESTLRKTSAKLDVRPARLRATVILAAALIAILLAGTGFAIVNQISLWDFLKGYSTYDIPAELPPQTDVVNQSLSSDDYVFTVLEAYREGRTATILARISENAKVSKLDEQLPWETVYVEMEDGTILEIMDEPRIIDGTICHAITCSLPEDTPDNVTLHVGLAWHVQGKIPVTLTRRDSAALANVTADHLTLEGTGIHFTDISYETTALNRTLTLHYTFDPAALTTPDLPSSLRGYYTGGDGVYHTIENCSMMNGSAHEITFSDIVSGSMTCCTEKNCTFFTDTYEPLLDGIYFELTDAEGNILACDTLNDQTAAPPQDLVYKTTFLLDGPHDVIRIRAYDCWTKYRWQDTIKLEIKE